VAVTGMFRFTNAATFAEQLTNIVGGSFFDNLQPNSVKNLLHIVTIVFEAWYENIHIAFFTWDTIFPWW
jgi:hypothetical protein